MRELIKTALWPVLPKPWHSPDMEFHYGLWQGVSALYAESGRQLGEENTRPFVLNHHIPAETLVSKYDGSRTGRSINMSALRTVMQNFDEAIAVTQAVKKYHLGRRTNNQSVGIWDLYILSRASIALIAYSIRSRREGPVQNRVSDALASQYQLISGVFMICRHMMENADERIAENRPVAAQDLYDYADQNEIFISFNGMACAGSTKKIIEFLEVCNDNSFDSPRNSRTLGSIVSEPDNWYRYALMTIELDCMIERERMSRPDQTRDKTTGRRAAEIYESVARYTKSFLDLPALDEQPPMSFEDRVLLRQNRILETLGRKKIRKISSKHIKARLS